MDPVNRFVLGMACLAIFAVLAGAEYWRLSLIPYAVSCWMAGSLWSSRKPRRKR